MPVRPPVLLIVSVGSAAATTGLSIVVVVAVVATTSGVGGGVGWMFSPLEWPLVVSLWLAPLFAPAGALLGTLAAVSGVVAATRADRTGRPLPAAVVGGALALFDLVAFGLLMAPLLGNAWA